jgi:hypothetical protein
MRLILHLPTKSSTLRDGVKKSSCLSKDMRFYPLLLCRNVFLTGKDWGARPKKSVHCPVAKFLVPDWMDLVEFGIGLPYRLACQAILAGGSVH